MAELHVHPVGDEWWTWRYFDPESGIELHSNETFDSREAAMESARRAYPDLDLADDGDGGD